MPAPTHSMMQLGAPTRTRCGEVAVLRPSIRSSYLVRRGGRDVRTRRSVSSTVLSASYQVRRGGRDVSSPGIIS